MFREDDRCSSGKIYSYVFHAIVGIVVAATVMDHTIWKFYSIFKCGNRKCDLPGLGVLCSLLLNRIDKDDLLA